MALPAVLLKAKGAIKKGAAAYNAAKQAKNTDGEEAISSLFNKLPIMIGAPIIAIFIIFLLTFIIIIVYPQIIVSNFFAGSAFGAEINDKVYSGNKAYLQWAIDIANDDSHGYSQCNRTGNPDYDCSSLVWYSLVEGAGFDAGEMGGYPFSTLNEASILKKVGFTEYQYTSESELQPGDILLRSTHTEIYVGDGQTVGAHVAETGGKCGTGGDQTGHEIDIGPNRGNWQTYYRLEQ